MNRDWLLKQIVEKIILGSIAGIILAGAVAYMERERAGVAEAAMANEARIAVTSQLFLRLSDALIETIDILRSDQRSKFNEEERPEIVKSLISEQASIVASMNTAFVSDETLEDWLTECANIYTAELHPSNLPINGTGKINEAIKRIGDCHSKAAISLSDRLRKEIKDKNDSEFDWKSVIFYMLLVSIGFNVFTLFWFKFGSKK